jgi:hypothetical protein
MTPLYPPLARGKLRKILLPPLGKGRVGEGYKVFMQED